MKFSHLRNHLRQRELPIQRDLQVGTWIWINIERNPSKLGKKYIAKMYKDWELIASYPADEISDIDLKFLTPNQHKNGEH